MSDLISRGKAIDIGRRATVDTNPSHFDSHQKFIQFMDDVEISSFGRWQWANGFNTALTAISIDLKQLPSAEPERKKGKWHGEGDSEGFGIFICDNCGKFAMMEYDFCPNCGADMREGEEE